MNSRRIGLAIVGTALGLAGLGLAGCAPPLPPPPPAPTPVATAPAVSYDGTYRGTVKVTGSGAGVPIGGCNTNPRFTLQVRDNAFTYQQPHPAAVVSGEGTPTINALNDSTAVYTATINPDGTFSGQSQVSGTITGTIANGHMIGTIEGIVCVYAFTADHG